VITIWRGTDSLASPGQAATALFLLWVRYLAGMVKAEVSVREAVEYCL
jgi:hypothetical protein